MPRPIVQHDPREYARGLQQLLISDSKRLGFLFGAGTSMAIKPGGSIKSKVPSVRGMTQRVLDHPWDAQFKTAVVNIVDELRAQDIPVQIEYILSAIVQKERVVGNERLCGLDRKEFSDLRKSIEEQIVDLVSVHKYRDAFIADLVHCDFARWIGQAQRKKPIEIFTTNYDYLLELALEYQEVAYFDGFVGAFDPFFSSTLVEDSSYYPQHTKLWKIHGSLGWDFCERTRRCIRRNHEASKIVVFPTMLKYEESKKQPYLSLFDRLSAFLKEDDGVLFVCGYSFGDQHINDVILRALAGPGTSHVIALYHDEPGDREAPEYLLTEDSTVADLGKQNCRLSIYGVRSAIIGGRHGKWKLKNEPSRDESLVIDSYFDEDAAEPVVGVSKDHLWSGEGRFMLTDFARFTDFLCSLRRDAIARGAWDGRA